MQWYNGRLICWSLGNCVFDQDFLATFRSGVLRTVFEGSTLLSARFYPATILRYRPAAVGGETALDVLGIVHERSDLDFRSTQPVIATRNAAYAPDPLSADPRLVLDRHAYRIETGAPATSTSSITVPAAGAAGLAPPSLTRSRAPGGAPLPAGLLFGRDLFGYGDFEDDAADGAAAGGLHWNNSDATADKGVVVSAAATSGSRVLRLFRTSSNSARVRMRPVARTPCPQNRLWADLSGAEAPLDGPPAYSMRFFARADGDNPASIILDVYSFDDANPTEDPDSTLLRTVEYTWSVPADSSWHAVLLDIPASAFDPGPTGLPANMAMFYVALYPPASGATELLVDDLQFVEWREAALLPDGFFSVDALRSLSGSVTVDLERQDE
jgi:hypothetical protein